MHPSSESNNVSGQIPSLNPSLLVILSVSAGMSVANSYYNQPMLGQLVHDYHLTEATVATIPVLTQLGNAVGVLFIAPLGDRLERKQLILVTIAALVIALVGAAIASTFNGLAAASFLVGLFATVAQQIVPLSVHIAPPQARGQVLGTVTGGILLGIILSRTLSGFISDWWDWRVMFWVAAGLMTMIGLVLGWKLPQVAPTTNLSYLSLLASLWTLVRTHKTLRRAVCIQALIFAAFLSFWSNLALLLSQAPYHLGGSAVGLLALMGAAGALAAPLAGRFADQRGHQSIVALGAGMVSLSFVLFGVFQGSMVVLILGVLIMDLGVQSSQVANQARVYALDRNARSCLNTVFMATMLLGGSLGAGIGGVMFSAFGWTGNCIFGAAAAIAAFVITSCTSSKAN